MRVRCPGCGRVRVDLPGGHYGWTIKPVSRTRRMFGSEVVPKEPETREVCAYCAGRKPIEKRRVELPADAFQGFREGE